MRSFLLALLLMMAGCSLGAICARAQPDEARRQSLYVELLGNGMAFVPYDGLFYGTGTEPFSVNYDLIFPQTAWGVRSGISVDDDLNESKIFATANYFFPATNMLDIEVGAGPLLMLSGTPRLAAIGTLGVRTRTIWDRYFLRLTYAPTLTTDGYAGYPGFSAGIQLGG